MAGMKDKLGDMPFAPPPVRAFDGSTYHPGADYVRLNGQLQRVAALMEDGRFRTLREIADEAGGTEASVSARLRDFRKPKYGAREVQRERVAGGLYRYRLVPIERR
ncbi:MULTISPECIES: hypothetical protein [unclassified Bradyrhizobium]|uniref:hypothetical protein n=1 Tax=unclassified Bradyrhizobium TaxID=2631580 RepID=UPI002FF2E136